MLRINNEQKLFNFSTLLIYFKGLIFDKLSCSDTILSSSSKHWDYLYWRKCMNILINASHYNLLTEKSLNCWCQVMMTSHHLWLRTSPHSAEILVHFLVADTRIVTPIFFFLRNCIWWIIIVTITHAHAT
jgi:hypothetical protein